MDIILMGTSKSGKSSIKKVVFEKMFPHETIYILPTLEIETLVVKSIEYCTLNIYEIPFTFKYEKKNKRRRKIFYKLHNDNLCFRLPKIR